MQHAAQQLFIYFGLFREAPYLHLPHFHIVALARRLWFKKPAISVTGVRVLSFVCTDRAKFNENYSLREFGFRKGARAARYIKSINELLCSVSDLRCENKETPWAITRFRIETVSMQPDMSPPGH